MDQVKQILNQELEALKAKLNETKALFGTETNIEMKQLYQEEIHALEGEIEGMQASIYKLDNPDSDIGDSEEKGTGDINPNKAILEIRAGTGGDEAGLFARNLYDMYVRYFDKNKFKHQILSVNNNSVDGIKTLTMEVHGRGVYETLKFESGVHRVQRVPETESSGRIHTSTATVAVLPELNKIEIDIRPEDLKMEFFRSGGAGGQNVNKVSTAVRLYHLPTGVVVECQEERTQLKNREKAMSMLQSRIYTLMQEQQVKDISDIRSEQVGSGERSEKIRTYNFPQDRITDHRINKNWHNLDAIMRGEIDNMLKDTVELMGKMEE